jgi:hypothetical protein
MKQKPRPIKPGFFLRGHKIVNRSELALKRPVILTILAARIEEQIGHADQQ